MYKIFDTETRLMHGSECMWACNWKIECSKHLGALHRKGKYTVCNITSYECCKCGGIKWEIEWLEKYQIEYNI